MHPDALSFKISTDELPLQIAGGYRKIKIRVGERLVIQSEMPPLTVDRAETVTDHDLLQDHSVVILLLGNSPVIRVGDFAEHVERTAHVKLLAGRHIEQGQVDRAAAAVAGTACNKALGEQLLFLQLRIKIRLHAVESGVTTFCKQTYSQVQLVLYINNLSRDYSRLVLVIGEIGWRFHWFAFYFSFSTTSIQHRYNPKLDIWHSRQKTKLNLSFCLNLKNSQG